MGTENDILKYLKKRKIASGKEICGFFGFSRQNLNKFVRKLIWKGAVYRFFVRLDDEMALRVIDMCRAGRLVDEELAKATGKVLITDSHDRDLYRLRHLPTPLSPCTCAHGLNGASPSLFHLNLSKSRSSKMCASL